MLSLQQQGLTFFQNLVFQSTLYVDLFSLILISSVLSQLQDSDNKECTQTGFYTLLTFLFIIQTLLLISMIVVFVDRRRKIVYMSYEGGNLAYVFVSYLYCITIDGATSRSECLQILYFYQTLMTLHALFLVLTLIVFVLHYFVRLTAEVMDEEQDDQELDSDSRQSIQSI